MKRLHFEININASAETIWKILWEDETYRKWTSAFSEGSYAKSDWQEGSKIIFLIPAGDGMFSKIEKLVPNSYMSFKHLGEIKNGVERPPTADTEKWIGAEENYTLKEAAGQTELSVELDAVPEFERYFLEKFPVALQNVKKLAEATAEEKTGVDNS